MPTALDPDWTDVATEPQDIVTSLGGAHELTRMAVSEPEAYPEVEKAAPIESTGGPVGQLPNSCKMMSRWPPALRHVRQAAGGVGGGGAGETVVVHPVVVGLEHRGEAAGPDGATEGEGTPPVSEDGNEASVPESAPAWAYEFSCEVMSLMGGRPRSMRSSLTTVKTCSGSGSADNADSETSKPPRPSWAAGRVDGGQPVGAAGCDVGGRVGRRQESHCTGGCTGQPGGHGSHDHNADR